MSYLGYMVKEGIMVERGDYGRLGPGAYEKRAYPQPHHGALWYPLPMGDHNPRRATKGTIFRSPGDCFFRGPTGIVSFVSPKGPYGILFGLRKKESPGLRKKQSPDPIIIILN